MTLRNLEGRIRLLERKVQLRQQVCQDHPLLDRLEAARERVQRYLITQQPAPKECAA